MLKAAGRSHPHGERSDDLSVLRSSRRSQNRTIRACSRSCRRQLLGVSVRSSSHPPVFALGQALSHAESAWSIVGGVQHNELEPERPCRLLCNRPSKNPMRGFFPLLRVRRKRPSHCAADQLISSWSQIDLTASGHRQTGYDRRKSIFTTGVRGPFCNRIAGCTAHPRSRRLSRR
jgi:hypothetical protein